MTTKGTLRRGLILAVGVLAAASARADGPFPDKNLETAVRAVLKHEPNVELTDEKLQNVYLLEAVGKEIKDVGVLEKLTKLSTLDLRDNQIEDVRPLTKQPDLKLLMIERNQIKDLTPLIDAAKADSAGAKLFAPYLRIYLDGNPLPE